jgi:hypothetical protein
MSSRFQTLPGVYAVCRLAPGSAAPAWASGEFISITSTADEVSVICRADNVPAEVRAERSWRVLKLVGPFPFTATGVLADFIGPLAKARISALAVATFDTDYVLVKEDALAAALGTLTSAGHPHVT